MEQSEDGHEQNQTVEETSEQPVDAGQKHGGIVSKRQSENEDRPKAERLE